MYPDHYRCRIRLPSLDVHAKCILPTEWACIYVFHEFRGSVDLNAVERNDTRSRRLSRFDVEKVFSFANWPVFWFSEFPTLSSHMLRFSVSLLLGHAIGHYESRTSEKALKMNKLCILKRIWLLSSSLSLEGVWWMQHRESVAAVIEFVSFHSQLFHRLAMRKCTRKAKLKYEKC